MKYIIKNYHNGETIGETESSYKPLRHEQIDYCGMTLFVNLCENKDGQAIVWVEHIRNGVVVGLYDWMGDCADD